MSQPPSVVARPVRSVGALVVALVLALVAGCGVRLETPPPAAPSPDARESARQRASADAVALAVIAGVAEPPADPAADPVGAARAAVAADAAAHLDLLGGLYEPDGDAGSDGADDTDEAASVPPEAEGAPAAPPADGVATPAPEPVSGPEVLASRLTEAAATARADAATVDDGRLARLLGSVAVNRLLSATRLSLAAGLTAPTVPPVVLPGAVPAGVDPADVAALVESEDAAGYALEVIAAKHGRDTRRLAGERAAVHRARSQGWAELAGVDGTGTDPRRVAYALPTDVADPAAAAALVQGLEMSLAAHYAGLLASAPTDDRAALVDAVAEATAAAVAWGAPLPTLPGLPERADG